MSPLHSWSYRWNRWSSRCSNSKRIFRVVLFGWISWYCWCFVSRSIWRGRIIRHGIFGVSLYWWNILVVRCRWYFRCADSFSNDIFSNRHFPKRHLPNDKFQNDIFASDYFPTTTNFQQDIFPTDIFPTNIFPNYIFPTDIFSTSFPVHVFF